MQQRHHAGRVGRIGRIGRIGRWRGTRVIAGVSALVVLTTTGMTNTASAETGPAHSESPSAQTTDPYLETEKIEPGLHSSLASEGETDFWVRLTARADLTTASGIEDWDERGAAVAAALRRTAGDSQAELLERLDAEGARYEAFWATNAIYVHNGSSELATELAAQPEVESLYPTTMYERPETEIGTEVATLSDSVEWGVANINADAVWQEYGTRGSGITIANIDTGVQYGHPALVRQYRGNLGSGRFAHDYNWFDAAGRCPDAPCDTDGHGTHTMGTMVGDDGADNRIGVAPEVNWIAANGCCPSDAALIASGQWMLEPTDLSGQNPDASKRPHIINNSWGSRFPSDDPFMEDISLAWSASGIFGVWSNGNSGPACRTSGSPGSRQINYSVGAYDVDNEIAGFSSRGTGQDGAIKPNIAAPGVDVRSSFPGNTYRSIGGTSMAAPHVAGAIALLWSAAPALIGDVDGTSSRLDGTAVDTPDLTCGGTAERNNVFGEGRLDALALIDSAELGDTGTLATTVIDASTGEPIAGAEVGITGLVGRERVTDADGTYALPLPPGDYTVTVAAFGYAEQSVDVTVVTGETLARRFELEPLDTVTINGRVIDGSGQGWPLYADVTVDGAPPRTHHTDPVDGAYSLTLPAGSTYTVTARSRSGGYETVTEDITVGDADEDVRHDFTVPIDLERCDAAGYAYSYDGLVEDFDNGDPDGWTVLDNAGGGNVWRFDDPFERGNRTGGTGGFAVAQSPGGTGGEVDTSLLTPVIDLRGHDHPILRFRQDFYRLRDVTRVRLSVDGGATWETVLEQEANARGPREELIELPQAANQPSVQVRFDATEGAFTSRFWQIDDVLVGTRTCDPVPGGLVLGQVRNRNTGTAVGGASVAADDDPTGGTVSTATPHDAALADGFYWMFVPSTGRQWFTATADQYQPETRRVNVVAGRVTRLDFRLPAGRLAIAPDDVAATVRSGDTGKVSFTVTNTGSAPAEVEFRERGSAHEIPRASEAMPDSTGAEVVRIPGEFSPLAFDESPTGDSDDEVDVVEAGTANAPTTAPWLDMPAYPVTIMDNAVGAMDGRIYSVGGRDTSRVLTAGYVYDSADGAWSPIADLPALRQAAAGAVIDDLFYVSGGWGVGSPEGQGTRTTYAYDPATDDWTTLADAPSHFAAAGRAVLDGQLYIVGGCTNSCTRSGVQRYDPDSDSWDTLANYPEASSHLACAGIAGQVYCTGGVRAGDVIWDRTYAYDPATDTWSRKADLPISLWGMSYTASSDRLIVSGGVTGGAPDFGAPAGPTFLTNESFGYDPATDTWSTLPASNRHTYRAGNTCGLTKVGGTMVVGFVPVDSVELLPTYGDCVPSDVDWMSLDTGSVTLEPGEKVEVTVEIDASTIDPGTYTAGVWIKENTPYLVYPVDVTLTVTAPM